MHQQHPRHDTFRWTADGAPPSLTAKFILSGDQRPQLSEVLNSDEVRFPVVDMGGSTAVEDIARASKEFGFFRIVNHGFSEEVWRRAAATARCFFMLPPVEKARFSGEGRGSMKVYSYHLRDWEDQREVSMWSEVAYHPWHPTRHFAGGLPENPPHYREHMVAYAREMGCLMARLLTLLSSSLGLHPNHLKTSLGEHPFLKFHANYYPPCPAPHLTMGLPPHTDSLALTVVRSLDDVEGLQVFKNGKWVALDRVPDSFTVNIGDQLEVLSNGRYTSGLHRVVSNGSRERMSLASFWGPGLDQRVGPIEDLVDQEHPPLFRSFTYGEFVAEHEKQTGTTRRVKQLFSLQPPASYNQE